MNDIINKFLLAGDKFMPEMHLRQPGFTYSACGSFNKNKERIQKFKETGDSRQPDLLIVLVNHLLKIKKESKNLKKQEIQDINTEMN